MDRLCSRITQHFNKLSHGSSTDYRVIYKHYALILNHIVQDAELHMYCSLSLLICRLYKASSYIAILMERKTERNPQ